MTRGIGGEESSPLQCFSPEPPPSSPPLPEVCGPPSTTLGLLHPARVRRSEV